MAAGDLDSGGEGGPGNLFMNHVIMEDLLDKLKLLNYEMELLKKSTSYRALSRFSRIKTANRLRRTVMECS